VCAFLFAANFMIAKIFHRIRGKFFVIMKSIRPPRASARDCGSKASNSAAFDPQ